MTVHLRVASENRDYRMVAQSRSKLAADISRPLPDVQRPMVFAVRARRLRRAPDRVPHRDPGRGLGRLAAVERIEGRPLLGLIVLPVEAAFWLGFALPFPWLTGIARAALLALAWTSRD